MKQIVIYIVILFVLSPVAFFSWMAFRMNYPSTGIDVKSYSRIPSAARDIYYVDAPLYGQCFFKLGKDEFETWLVDKNYIGNKITLPNSDRIIQSKIKGFPMEISDCTKADLYEWRDVDGGGFSVNYFTETGLVVYDWSSN